MPPEAGLVSASLMRGFKSSLIWVLGVSSVGSEDVRRLPGIAMTTLEVGGNETS